MRDLRLSIVPPARGAGAAAVLVSAAVLGACLPSEFDRPPSATPVQIAARGFGCAVTEQGTVRCWGSNDNGQLGADVSKTPFNRVNEPVEVVGLTGVRAVGVGDAFNCALLTTGEVKCWGFNASGQLGQAKEVTDSTSLASSRTPLTVVGLSAVSKLAVGDSHACALTATGTVWCWGDGGVGQLADGVDLASVGTAGHISTKPVQVPGVTGALDLAARGDLTCVVTAAHAVQCWGRSTSKPAPVVGLDQGIAQVAVGGGIGYGPQIVCGTTTAGAVSCQGTVAADAPVLGRGASSSTPASTPAPVMGLGGAVSALSLSGTMACAIVAGAVKCWGSAGEFDQVLGLGRDLTFTSLPMTLPGLDHGATSIAVGTEIACAIADGRLSCWGCKACIGDGSTEFSGGDPQYTPVHVVGLP